MSRMVSNGTKKAIGVFEIFGHLYLKKRPNAHFYKKNTLIINRFVVYFQVENGNKNGQMPTFSPLFKQK